MKGGKACGPFRIAIEMIKAGEDTMPTVITDLINLIIKKEQIPDDWNQSAIVNCFKGKCDITKCDNYRGLKLL